MKGHPKRGKVTPKDQSSYDSMASAAAAMGISKDVLAQAKRKGAPGFRGSRVFGKEVLAWLADHKEELNPKNERAGVQLKILLEQHRKLKLANDQKESKVIPVEWVETKWAAIGAKVMTVLRQKLENEYPSLVCGLDPAQARVYGKRLVDEISTAIRA